MFATLGRVRIHQAYRFARDPTVRQRRALASHCGSARRRRAVARLARAHRRVARVRTFACTACGLRMDRDLNAARNLAWWGDAHAAYPPHVAGSAPETENARGGAAAIRPVAGEGSREARAGNVPEPSGSTGGRIRSRLTPAA